MAIHLTCEGCGRRVKVPEVAAGRKGKCPSCGRVINIPTESVGDWTDAGPATTVPAVDAAQAGRLKAGDVSSPTGTNALGVASLVLGILALLIAWIPLLGLISWPLGGVGLILGLAGLILAARKRWGTTSAIAGLVTNGAAVAVALAVSLWTGRALQEAARRSEVELATKPAQHDIPGLPASVPVNTPAPNGAASADGTFSGQDRNGDGRLNADEIPDALKARFAEVDADGDGHIDKAEWDRGVVPGSDASPARGKVMAQRVFTAADDFVVDVWHNGKRVADDKRAVVGENYGATAEKMELEVREGDWLVFNVANNRLRWGGASYFGVAGVNDGEPQIGFMSDPADGRWSYCDDPARVPAFIAHPSYLADQAALAPANPWAGGDGEMKARVSGWNGRPVWGRERTTWVKFVARPAPATASSPVTAPAPAVAKANGSDDQPGRGQPGPAASTAGKPESAVTPAPGPAVTLTKRATFTGHPALVFCVAVTPDGRKVVSGSAPQFGIGANNKDVKTLIVWDVADQGKTPGVIPLEQSITSLAITPNGRSVVVPVENGLCVFDLKTGRLTATLPGPAQTNTMSVAISPDGKLAAGGFSTNTKEVILWDLKTRKPLRTLRGHTSGVIALALRMPRSQLK